MLQLVYISSAVAHARGGDILHTSVRNNTRDGITGLLYSDGVRFMQALEGPEDKVEAAYARIKLDQRHRAPVILSRRTVEDREFGPWAMAARSSSDDGAVFLSRVEKLIANASSNVRATFESFARVDRAA